MRAYKDCLGRIGAASGAREGTAAPPLPWWIDPRKRASSPWYAATCYLLLHKQELVSRVWKEFPALREADSVCQLEEPLWRELCSCEE